VFDALRDLFLAQLSGGVQPVRIFEPHLASFDDHDLVDVRVIKMFL
jgi:hypothetical protein